MCELDKVLSDFVGSAECEKINEALLETVCAAYEAGWNAAAGSGGNGAPEARRGSAGHSIGERAEKAPDRGTRSLPLSSRGQSKRTPLSINTYPLSIKTILDAILGAGL